MSWFNRGDANQTQAPPDRYARIPDNPYPVQNNSLPSNSRSSSRGLDYVPRQAPPPVENREKDPHGGLLSSLHRNGSKSVRTTSFEVVGAPDDQTALKNCLICNHSDFSTGTYAELRWKGGSFVFLVYTDNRVPPGKMGAGNEMRSWMEVAKGDLVEAYPFEPNSALGRDHIIGTITIELRARSAAPVHRVFDSEQMEAAMKTKFKNMILTQGQILIFDADTSMLHATVKKVQNITLHSGQPGGGTPPAPIGILGAQSEITFVAGEGKNPLQIKGSSKRAPANAIIQPDFKFEDMGIGGLDSEFSNIFRRAFASRIFPPGLVEKLGIQHVKGILLYGPPGTGKTLMARQIGKMLNAREPKIVNGPEILNKFVGQSEENIRKLFAEAEKEYKAKGDDSGLHIIIFDELDAICKQRGSQNSGTGVGDSVVNQLLSKMDGVDQLNNILIIGMTNRLDMIDEALLRPGRLEVHMEISLPDENGRLQILKIHTIKMFNNQLLEPNVDLGELANLTKNFSGAEIAGLIKSATSFAFTRHIKVGTQAGISTDVDKMKIGRDDFLLALDEVKPAFGVAEEELSQVVQNGIIRFDPFVEKILRDGSLFVEQVRKSGRTPLVSVLLHGEPSTGKTALAAQIAMSSKFPFIKLISPENMIGYNEIAKVGYLNKIFTDSYKSMFSVIVIDSIERILDWSDIGPRFSNMVLQALLVLLTKRPPKGKRLLILVTTSNDDMVTAMKISDTFVSKIEIPPIKTLSALLNVIKECDLFESEELFQNFIGEFQLSGLDGNNRFGVGVKKLLEMIEMARQDVDPVGTLINRLKLHHGYA